MRQVMDSEAMRRAIVRMAHEIVERNHGVQDLLCIGIQRGGSPMAQRLAEALGGIEGVAVPVSGLHIGPWRDDRRSPAAEPLQVDPREQVVVLVDDVLYTGRTVRAALDALAEAGRPRRVQLAVMVDRGHRELPIRADFVGKNLPTTELERVLVRWEDPAGVYIHDEAGR